jgi:protease-4
MMRVIARILATIGGVVVGLLVVGAGSRLFWRGHVPSRTVVEIDLDQPLAEFVPDDPLAGLLRGRRPRLRDVLDAMERASQDDHVVGLVGHVSTGAAGLGQIQELRDAVKAFRASGKRAVAFGEAFGESGPGNGAYYLATAFDEIYVQPSGDLGLTGLVAETPFVRGTLDKLGIVPRFSARGKYKTAINMFTERRFTEAHREAASQLVASQFGQIVRGVAEARKLPEDRVRAIVDQAPLSAQQALDSHLVDGLAYRDEVYAKFEGGGEKPTRLPLLRYLDRAGPPPAHGDVVALIHGVGTVQRGKSGVDPLSGDVSMGSDTVAKAFRDAVDDSDVRAIVFRIDSPGGSYVASDTIWREVSQARAAGKPVVVSMGNVAASGGYFVAMPADRIVAQPGTITGSIGVFSGKMLMSSFFDKLGITFDEVHTGANATMWSSLQDFSPAEKARFEAELDRVYDDFTSKAAQGRKLSKEKVLEIAQGRVWTGEDALGLGLVDALGGYGEALRSVRETLGLKPDAPLRLQAFPPSRGFFTSLVERFLSPPDDDDTDGEDGATATLRAGLEAVHAVTRALRAVGLLRDQGPLLVPGALGH